MASSNKNRRFLSKSVENDETDNAAPNNDSENEVTEMLDNTFDVDNDTESSEFGDFTNEAEVNEPDAEEMQRAFEDAAKDAEGTDLESDESESNESPVAEVEKPKAVPLTEEVMEVIQFGNELYAATELDDTAKMMGASLATGFILPIHSARNSVLDIVDALNKAHFSEAHDDVFTRAEQESDNYDLVKFKLEKAKEAKAEYERLMTLLSDELKSVLGIKPLSDDDRKAYVEDAKAKLGQIDTQIRIMKQTNESNATKFVTPLIEYVESLPALPPVTARGTSTTRKIGASTGETKIRARLGYENGGGIVINDDEANREPSFTKAILKLKSLLEWEDLKSEDITKMWLDAAGISDWTKTGLGKDNAVEFTLTNPANDKSAQLKVIREVA